MNNVSYSGWQVAIPLQQPMQRIPFLAHCTAYSLTVIQLRHWPMHSCQCALHDMLLYFLANFPSHNKFVPFL